MESFHVSTFRSTAFFLPRQSEKTEFQCWEMTDEPLGQFFLLNRWGPQRSWHPLTTQERRLSPTLPPPHTQHAATPAGVTRITPASLLSKEPSKKAKLPTW